jgi:hypothetical protein
MKSFRSAIARRSALLVLLLHVGAAVAADSSGTPAAQTECKVVPHSSDSFTVTFAPPTGIKVQGLTLTVDYPSTKVVIPGSAGDASVKQHVKVVPADVIAIPNDLGTALRESVAGKNGALAPGRLLTIDFQRCQGADPAVPGDFGCSVKSASDTAGNTIDGVTCSVTK